MLSIEPNCAEIKFNDEFRFSLSYVDFHLLRTWMIGNILLSSPVVAVFARQDPLTGVSVKFVYKPKAGTAQLAPLHRGEFEFVIGQTMVKLDTPHSIETLVDFIGKAICASPRFPFHPLGEFFTAKVRHDVYYLEHGHTFIAGHDIYCFGAPEGWNEVLLNHEEPEDDWVQRVDAVLV